MDWAAARELLWVDPLAGRSAKGLKLMILIWLAVTGTLFFGLLTLGADSAAGSDIQVIEVETLALGQLGSIQNENPSASYAGQIWSVVNAMVIKLDPQDPFSRPVVEVDLIVTNLTEVVSRVHEDDLALIGAEGQRHESARFRDESHSYLAIQPYEMLPVKVVFDLMTNVNPSLTDLRLEIKEPNREPATVGLDGRVEEPTYPIELALNVEPEILNNPDEPGRDMVIRPIHSTIDLDVGPYRARLGTRLYLINVLVQHSVASPNPQYMQAEFWELNLGGLELSPARVTKSGATRVGEDEIQIIFIAPADDEAKRFDLIAAADSDEPVVFEITD